MIPIKHIHSMVVSFFQVVSDSLIELFFNVKRMSVVVARNYIFKFVSLFKSKSFEMDNIFQDRSAPLIVSNKLYKFIEDALQVGVCFISNDYVAVQIHEKLHSFTFGQTSFTNYCKEHQIASKAFKLFFMNIDIQFVFSRLFQRN